MTKDRHRMAVAAHLLLRDSDGRVLFMRRAKTGYADGQWAVPAGHVESGETIVAACVRETREEIGVSLECCGLSTALVQHKLDVDGEERIDVFFAAELPDGQQPTINEPDRCDAVVWATVLNAPAPLVPYVAAALRTISDSPGTSLAYFGFD